MKPSDPSAFGDFQDNLKDLAGMSDEELARLMEGGKAPSGRGTSFEDLPPGERVRGTVLEIQRDEVLVELDRKTLGVIDLTEFAAEAPPAPGSSIQAEFVRYDRVKDICVLSLKTVRTEVAWEDLRPGQQVEGKVVEAVKGGLVLDLKGVRAFLPISQIDLARVESLEPYLGRSLRCEVQEVDRGAKNLVVSRRAVLERERAGEREGALASLKQGDVRSGTVVRLTEHGAFVSLGAVDGLLHASRIHQHFKGTSDKSPLKVGQVVEVVVTQVDAERGRVGLDLHRVSGDSWESTIVSYSVGDEVTSWISSVGPEGAIISLEEGLEAVIPLEDSKGLGADLRAGAIVKGTIASIDRERHRIVVRPRTA